MRIHRFRGPCPGLQRSVNKISIQGHALAEGRIATRTKGKEEERQVLEAKW